MKIEKFTFEMQVTRSHAYQSVKAGLSVEVALDSEDDNFETVFAEVRKDVYLKISKTAEKALSEALDNAANTIA